MSSTTDKIEGMADKTAGVVKENVGKVVGNHELEAEGKVQKHKGDAEQAVGKAKDAVKNVIDKA
jgi:uncharacterized protein YjbJ (UPF0337 family)